MTNLIEKNIKHIHEIILNLGEDISKLKYNVEFLFYEESEEFKAIDITKSMYSIMDEFDNLNRRKQKSSLFTIQKNGYLFKLEREQLIYKVYKKTTAIAGNAYELIYESFLDFDTICNLQDLFEFALNKLNEYEQINHPDVLTSKILERLALPQNYVPSHIRLDMHTMDFDDMKADKLEHIWYKANNFELNVIMGPYKACIETNGKLDINGENFYENYYTIDEFLSEKNVSELILNDFDFTVYCHILLEQNDLELESVNRYIMHMYQDINNRNYLYEDDDMEEVTYELSYLDELIALAVETLNKINNMDYDYELSPE